jgi:hypothetical protein
MTMEEVKAMLCIDHIVWNALVSLLEKHPAESLHEAGPPPWTSRDVYAHFSRWLNHSNACMEAYCAGRPQPPLEADPEEMNTIWHRADSGMSLDEAREKAQAAFTRRMDTIKSIPLYKWDGELEKLARYDGATHYAMHINYIVVT